MVRYYLSCPICTARLKRTGEKEKEIRRKGKWNYLRIYECSKCGTFWEYSETNDIVCYHGAHFPQKKKE
jgi:uncharacterized Zn finger protein